MSMVKQAQGTTMFYF